VKVYSDGLPVGDAPQTQVGASAFVRFSQGLNMTLEWRYNDRLYADFDPTLRNDPDDRAHSLKLPSYNLVNLGMSWKKKWGMGETTLFMNINNILDETYIERGKDGSDHTMDSFRGYWGFGINGTVGVRLTL
jgi:outer membrane receptor protein involved in Fe transport